MNYHIRYTSYHELDANRGDEQPENARGDAQTNVAQQASQERARKQNHECQEGNPHRQPNSPQNSAALLICQASLAYRIKLAMTPGPTSNGIAKGTTIWR